MTGALFDTADGLPGGHGGRTRTTSTRRSGTTAHLRTEVDDTADRPCQTAWPAVPATPQPRRVSEPGLRLVPVRSKDAKRFVRDWHRHHPPPAGLIFAVGAADDEGVLRAVAITGRPVARHLDDGMTLEVTRVASDGIRNANSMLYGASWRAAKALGYRKLVTYTQAGESGGSLRGAGWRIVAELPPRPGWHAPSRPRTGNGNDHVARMRWEAP